MHQRDVDHRRLVDDDQIGVDRAFLVALETPGSRVHFEQPMDRLRRQAGRLAQAPCRAAGRRAKRDREPFRRKNREERVDDRRLADTRAAGHDERLGRQRLTYRLGLAPRKHQAGSCRYRLERDVGSDRPPWERRGGDRPQALGDGLFRPVERRKKKAVGVADRVGDDRSFRQFVIDCRLHQLSRGLEQFGSPGQELTCREAAVAVRCRLEEREPDTGPEPDHRRLLDAEAHCQRVRSPEADAADVARELVRVFRHHPDRVGAVRLVDAHRARRADAVLVQEDHDLADRSLLGPRFADPCGADGADSLHLPEAVRFRVDHVEDRIAERVDQLPGVDRTDAMDEAGSEIPLDPLVRGGFGCLQELGAELAAVGPVLHPGSGGGDPFAGRYRGGMSHQGDEVGVASSLDTQDREAVLRVVERHPLDRAGNHLVIGGIRSGWAGHGVNVARRRGRSRLAAREGRDMAQSWMSRRRASVVRTWVAVAGAAVVAAGMAGPAPATAQTVEWPSYAADAAATKYTPLDQIDASSVDRLEIAWRQPVIPDAIPEWQHLARSGGDPEHAADGGRPAVCQHRPGHRRGARSGHRRCHLARRRARLRGGGGVAADGGRRAVLPTGRTEPSRACLRRAGRN